jgi:hypothetical protein
MDVAFSEDRGQVSDMKRKTPLLNYPCVFHRATSTFPPADSRSRSDPRVRPFLVHTLALHSRKPSVDRERSRLNLPEESLR